MKAKKHFVQIGLILVVFLAGLLRLVYLGRFPCGFTPDEAAQGYTAYSILKTGRDEWGVRWPLNPRSFGDFKAPLYTYLAIPSVAVFGLNEAAVRLPNALLGTLAVLVVYFLAKELFSQQGEGSRVQLVALAASLLLAISPWHLSLSRLALEANLTTFFLPLALLFFFWGLRRPWFLVLSSLSFGLNLFSYHSAKLVTPLVLVSVLIGYRQRLADGWEKKKFPILVSLLILGLALTGLGWGFLKGAGARVGDIGVFAGGGGAADQRYFAVLSGLPPTVARLFNNKISFAGQEMVDNYFSYLSPYFLFAQGAKEATYGMFPDLGVLYLFELPLVLFAFYLLIKEKKTPLIFLWSWVILSPLPASLARGVSYHANRVAIMMPAIQILSGYGLIRLWARLRRMRAAGLLALATAFLILFSFLNFLEIYFFQSPRFNAPKMNYGWKEAAAFISETEERREKKLIVDRGLGEPQAYLMFYLKLEPALVQKATSPWLSYEKEGSRFVDQLGNYQLGKIEFRDLVFPPDWTRENTLLIGQPADFSLQEGIMAAKTAAGEIKAQKLIYYPDGKVALVIIEL